MIKLKIEDDEKPVIDIGNTLSFYAPKYEDMMTTLPPPADSSQIKYSPHYRIKFYADGVHPTPLERWINYDSYWKPFMRPRLEQIRRSQYRLIQALEKAFL